jgi:hypothetical protein
MNALGWQKRRSYLNKAGMLEQDKMVELAKQQQENGVPEMPWRCKEDLQYGDNEEEEFSNEGSEDEKSDEAEN